MIQPAVAGVIGWPVAHSKSPLIHRFWLAGLGIDGDYSRFPVVPHRLEDFVRAMPAMGLRGVNVTVPHKVAVLAMLDEVDDTALSVGAANSLKVFPDGRIGGANTDIDGIFMACRQLGIAGREVVILGSGGAARAALGAAAALQAGWVTIVARDVDAGVAMLRQAGQPGSVLPFGGALPPSPEARLLFNATSLGMTGQPPLHFPLDALPGDCTVFDAVYVPLETPLLRAARARGLATIDGLTMLIGQAAVAFEIFFGAEAPRQHDEELRALLMQ
jgi:shikimate dehydrogenase